MSLTLLRPSLYFLPGLPYGVVDLRNALVAQVIFLYLNVYTTLYTVYCILYTISES